MLQLAASLLDTNRLRVEAIPQLDQLARTCGERTNLGILHRGEVLYLAGVEKPNLPMIYSRFGKTAAAHCSSLGKAILAALPENEVETILENTELARLTKNTITERQALGKELARIRKQGYALDREEHTLGTFCAACAIIVEGRPVGAIGATSRSMEALTEHLEAIRHTAEVIAHRLDRGI